MSLYIFVFHDDYGVIMEKVYMMMPLLELAQFCEHYLLERRMQHPAWGRQLQGIAGVGYAWWLW